MALDLFRVMGGVQIDDSIQILEGSGAPSLDAPLGSVYSDITSGSVGYFQKIGSGPGADKWLRLATQDYVQSFGASAISWREPVVVRSTASSLPATTVDTVDGHTVVAGDRVLFSDISGGAGPNVYVASGSTGAWVWTEDTNLESSGDTVYVTSGTNSGKTYTFNGTAWVWISQDSSDELGFIRSFIGKNAVGSETPSYSSTNQVSNGQALETAIGALDGAIGADVGGSPNVVTAGNSVFGSISELDSAIGADVTTGGTILAANTIQQNIQALDSAIGADVTSSGSILSTNTVNQNITAINNTVQSLTLTTTGTDTASDTAPVGVEMAKWLIKVEDSGNVRAEEVFAITDGSTVDFTRYGVLKLGSAVTPFSVAVVLDSGQIKLTVTGPTGSSVIIKRITVA